MAWRMEKPLGTPFGWIVFAAVPTNPARRQGWGWLMLRLADPARKGGRR